jgi:hypothetical protein
MGNEEKPPMTAAARIGMTMSERFSLLRLVIGTKKIAANPPSAAPMAQLATAITSEEIASAPAAVGFSATADVANPNRVYLYTAQRTMVRTMTMPKMQSRSSPIGAPKIVTEFVGRIDETGRPAAPKMRSTASWVTRRRARVATTLIRFEASLSRRMTR